MISFIAVTKRNQSLALLRRQIGRWMLGVGCFSFPPKKYRPPRPMGVKGGCSPQNNLGKLRC